MGRATPVARTRTRTSADAHATECCPRSGRVAVERRLPSTPAHVGVVAAHAGRPAHIYPAVRARSDESAPTRGRLNSRSVFLAAGHAAEALIALARSIISPRLPHAAPPPRFKLFDLCMTKSCHDHCARLLLLPAGFFAFLIFERPWDSTPHAPGSGSPPRSACLVARVMPTPRVLVLGLAVWVSGVWRYTTAPTRLARASCAQAATINDGSIQQCGANGGYQARLARTAIARLLCDTGGDRTPCTLHIPYKNTGSNPYKTWVLERTIEWRMGTPGITVFSRIDSECRGSDATHRTTQLATV